MNGPDRRVGAVILGTALLATACSIGTPDPELAQSLPPRPRDLKIADLAPCDVITPDQRLAVGVGPGEASAAGDARPGECAFVDEADGVTLVQLNPRTSATSFVPGAVAYQGDTLNLADPRLVEVEGYGAVEAGQVVNFSNSRCWLGIDVGPEASIVVVFEDTSDAARSRQVGSRGEGCARASRFASMVLATVKAKQTP